MKARRWHWVEVYLNIPFIFYYNLFVQLCNPKQSQNHFFTFFNRVTYKETDQQGKHSSALPCYVFRPRILSQVSFLLINHFNNRQVPNSPVWVKPNQYSSYQWWEGFWVRFQIYFMQLCCQCRFDLNGLYCHKMIKHSL